MLVSSSLDKGTLGIIQTLRNALYGDILTPPPIPLITERNGNPLPPTPGT